MVFLFLKITFWYALAAMFAAMIWESLGLPGDPYGAGAWVVHIIVLGLVLKFLIPLARTAYEAVITVNRLGPMKYPLTDAMVSAARQNLKNKKEND